VKKLLSVERMNEILAIARENADTADDRDLYRAIRVLDEACIEDDREIAAAWSALGTTAEEAADGPDVAHLSDAIRVCRRYDEDQIAELRGGLNKVYKAAVQAAEDAGLGGEQFFSGLSLPNGIQVIGKILKMDGEFETELCAARAQLDEVRDLLRAVYAVVDEDLLPSEVVEQVMAQVRTGEHVVLVPSTERP